MNRFFNQRIKDPERSKQIRDRVITASVGAVVLPYSIYGLEIAPDDGIGKAAAFTALVISATAVIASVASEVQERVQTHLVIRGAEHHLQQVAGQLDTNEPAA